MTSLPVSYNPRKTADPIRAKSFVVREIPINASDFQSGNTSIFKIRGGAPTQFASFSDSFIRVKVNNKNTDRTMTLGMAGLSSLLNKTHLSQQGAVLGEISNFAQYTTIQLAKKASHDYLNGFGQTLSGTKNYQEGITIPANSSVILCLPMSHLGGLLSTSKAVPLAGSDMELRLTWGSADYGAKWGSGSDSVTNASLSFTDVEMVMQITQISDNAVNSIKKLGDFSVLAKGVATHNNFIKQGSSAHTINLATQVSQFLGLDWVATKSSFDSVSELQNSCFIQNGLRRWYLTIGGEQIENSKGILADAPSEIVALMGVDGGYLGKLQNVPSITPSNFTSDNHSGCVFTQSTENFKSSCATFGEYSSGDDNFCSGRSTLNTSVVVQLEYDSGSTNDTNFSAYVQYGMLITFDPQHMVFRVSH